MPVSDTEIIDWKDDFLSDDTNTPYDSVDIGALMDDEERNYRSVVRAEAENRMWVRFGHTVAYSSATAFTTPGDRTDVYIPGRRLRATLTGPAYIYGHVVSASYGSNVTTVTCQWDAVVFTTFTVATNNQITSNSNFLGLAANDIVEFGTATLAPARRIRKVSSVVPGLPNTYNFTTGDPWISDLVALAPTRMAVPSAGIDSSLSEIALGLFTPVNYQSGFPGYVFGGTFNIILDGVSTSFDVPTPLRADTLDPIWIDPTTFKVGIQPLGVVSGAPSGNQWTRARNNFGANTNQTFRVVLPSAESGGTVKYAYVIVRDQ
jgi:hypothetical protein